MSASGRSFVRRQSQADPIFGDRVRADETMGLVVQHVAAFPIGARLDDANAERPFSFAG